MTTSEIDLSIIIPAYMEAAGIADTLEQLAAFLKTRDYGEVEVLLVIPDSPDGTAKIADSRAKLFKRFRIVHAGPRVGKGRDVRLGIYEARGRYRLFMDADLATPLKHLDQVHAGIERGDQVMIAVRSLWSIHKGLLRKAMSKFGNLFIQVLILPGIKDTQCGFKAFEASVAEDIFSRQTMLGWSFDAEILKVARLCHYKIALIDAPDWKDPKAASMGLVGDSALHAAIQTLLDTVTIRMNVWAGKYKKPTYVHKHIYS
ncbi:MAG TPA: glycosyltransferase [Candidatus Saccharimonadia bacterium]